jgi:endoribonuclease Nob1
MVLDTSAFVAGFDPFSFREEQVAPPMVEEEVKRNTMTLLRFSTAVENGKLKIFAPLPKFETIVKNRGDIPQILTDDYSIQNVAKQLGLAYTSLATFGIKRLLTWIRYCPACHRKYPANFKANECPICGTPLKRKPQKAELTPEGRPK